MKQILFLFLFLSFAHVSIGQVILRENETLLFSFNTRFGKRMLLSENRSDNSVCYRFGTADKTELEYHSLKSVAGHKISYSFYLRGGGPSNEGMDLNYVYFTNNHFQYVIFDNYYAVENKKTTGLKIINLNTKEATVIQAGSGTIKGNLVQFRDNKLLDTGEEIFD